jgi:hypothetical protein
MVPLEKVLKKPERKPELNVVELERPSPPRPAPAPDPPRRRMFKILDVMTRETLAEDVDLRAVLDLLGDVRSVVDVQLYAWHPERERWRMLGLSEQRALWEARRAARHEPAAA